MGVQAVHVPPPEFVAEQLRSVLSDIPISVVKTGMLPNQSTVRVVCSALRQYATTIRHVVVDPVLVATSGDSLATGDVAEEIRRELFPLATVVTPNIPEASRLTGYAVNGIEGMRQACVSICEMGAGATLLKGGHLEGASVATDVLYNGNEFEAFAMPRIDSRSTHGTGCTLASGIAAELAKGFDLANAVRSAKQYVHDGIRTSFQIGGGHGPLNHLHGLDCGRT